MTIAIEYGVEICIEGNITINWIQEKTRESSQTHLTLQHHPSEDPRMLCAPFALSSLGVLRLHGHLLQSTISLLTKLHNQYS